MDGHVENIKVDSVTTDSYSASTPLHYAHVTIDLLFWSASEFAPTLDDILAVLNRFREGD